jgi:hypothetical protein
LLSLIFASSILMRLVSLGPGVSALGCLLAPPHVVWASLEHLCIRPRRVPARWVIVAAATMGLGLVTSGVPVVRAVAVAWLRQVRAPWLWAVTGASGVLAG